MNQELGSLHALIQDLKDGKTTSRELVERCFQTIETKDGEIGAFLRIYKEEALAAAEASDARRAEGKTLGELDGIPVAIKDNISYQDHITSAASKMLADYTAPYDATVVTKLKDQGAILIGQCNMDEFAMGSSGENSAVKPTKNPHDVTRVPGGSSSGSVASVAAHMVPLAYGSDTGGSIRLPAAFCGVVGLKPTYGAVSRYGLMAMASSLDQIGPIGQTVDDVAIGFRTVRGVDAKDATSQTGADLAALPKYRIGIPKQFIGDGLDSQIRQALDDAIAKLEADGHTIVRDIDLPMIDKSIAIYYLIVAAEVSSNFARYDGIRFGVHESVINSRTKGFGPEVKRRIMLGTFALSAGYADAYYKRAQAARQELKEEFAKVFESVDVILGPTAPELAFKLGEKSDDPLKMYLSDVYTVLVNLAGVPALSVPVGWGEDDGSRLPIGLQLIGSHWSEDRLFDLGKQIEWSSNE